MIYKCISLLLLTINVKRELKLPCWFLPYDTFFWLAPCCLNSLILNPNQIHLGESWGAEGAGTAAGRQQGLEEQGLVSLPSGKTDTLGKTCAGLPALDCFQHGTELVFGQLQYVITKWLITFSSASLSFCTAREPVHCQLSATSYNLLFPTGTVGPRLMRQGSFLNLGPNP